MVKGRVGPSTFGTIALPANAAPTTGATSVLSPVQDLSLAPPMSAVCTQTDTPSLLLADSGARGRVSQRQRSAKRTEPNKSFARIVS